MANKGLNEKRNTMPNAYCASYLHARQGHLYRVEVIESPPVSIEDDPVTWENHYLCPGCAARLVCEPTQGDNVTHLPSECQWFAGCHAPAHKEVRHPVLGWVPTCNNHIAWLGDPEVRP